jgi:hypothetical protein
MRIALRISKAGISLYRGAYDVADAESFGKACADAWSQLMQQQFRKESSVGALMEHLENDVLDQLDGAIITMERVQ